MPWAEVDRLGYRPGRQAWPADPNLGAKLHVGEALPYQHLIFEWWDRWPLAGAAVLTGLSRLLVVDVDPRHDGHRTLARLVQHRPLPATRVVRTRGGGLHLYYRTATLARSKAAVLGPGIDVRSAGGLAFSPPTPGYTVVERRPVAPVPRWLVDGCPKPARGGGRSAELPFDDPRVLQATAHAVRKILEAPPGSQHDTVYGQARYAYSHSLDDQVTRALYAAAATIAPEPWRRRNWERAIADARHKEARA